MTKFPDIDLGECVECDGCIEVCPEVFRRNESMGYIEVPSISAPPAVFVGWKNDGQTRSHSA
jgi:ferredoxin